MKDNSEKNASSERSFSNNLNISSSVSGRNIAISISAFNGMCHLAKYSAIAEYLQLCRQLRVSDWRPTPL